MKKNPKIVAVAWAPHQDHVEKDAKQLGAKSYFVHYFSFSKSVLAPIKYIPQAFRTLMILLREKPKLVYVLNPPVIAPMVVYLFCLGSGARMIMACHYSALYGGKWKWLLPVTRFLAKHALVNIVDQERNKQLLNSWGAEALILEKPPFQESPPDGKAITNGRFKIAVINTFAEDDPVETILEAASLCPDVDWHILGDTKRASKGLLDRAPKNVTFTGYLLKADYWNCLHRANAVMTLTTREYSMMAGAIDSLAIGKPIILSRQPTLMGYFTRGVVFVENESASIVRGIRVLQESEELLNDEIISLGAEKQAKWEQGFAHLQSIIAQYG